MKLLIVSQYFWPEPFRINDIALGLRERGHCVDVLTSVPNVPEGRFYPGYGWFRRGEKKWNGIGIERVGVVQRKKGGAARLFLNCASYAVNSLFHLPKLRKNNYDAVFVFNNSPVTQILPAKRMAKKAGIPNIVFLLDIWPQSMFFLLGMKDSDKKTLFRRISYAVSRWFYHSADLMLISSRGFEEKLREMSVGCRCEYFPNYAETPKPAPPLERESLGLRREDFVLGFSGNVGRAQGLGLTLEATKNAAIPNLRWLIVGAGPELQPLKRQVETAGLAGHYVFTGWVDGGAVPGYLDLCDALFLPLKADEVLNLTVPAKLQTYMSCGKPVLAFMNGAGAMIVCESGCGAVAAAEDTAALADAILSLKELPAARLREMGENGREYCKRNFDRDQLIDRLVLLIEEEIRNFHNREEKGRGRPEL